jgi:uncharacterized protein YdeI (YjbR/CyaY-like superfamily)
VKTFVAQTADQWRQWLDEHHDSESEVWLVTRLDDSRYARKFTPRKADSPMVGN